MLLQRFLVQRIRLHFEGETAGVASAFCIVVQRSAGAAPKAGEAFRHIGGILNCVSLILFRKFTRETVRERRRFRQRSPYGVFGCFPNGVIREHHARAARLE